MQDLINNVERMTSIEIAEVTGKQHKDVMRAIRNMEPAWEKICGRKFALTSRTISQPNGGTRKITGLKFQLSTYKDPTGRTLLCYTITEVAMMLNTQISQIFLDDHG